MRFDCESINARRIPDEAMPGTLGWLRVTARHHVVIGSLRIRCGRAQIQHLLQLLHTLPGLCKICLQRRDSTCQRRGPSTLSLQILFEERRRVVTEVEIWHITPLAIMLKLLQSPNPSPLFLSPPSPLPRDPVTGVSGDRGVTREGWRRGDVRVTAFAAPSRGDPDRPTNPSHEVEHRRGGAQEFRRAFSTRQVTSPQLRRCSSPPGHYGST